MYRYFLYVSLVISLAALPGCTSRKAIPGTGGKSSAKEIKKTDHPGFPEGVACYVCHKHDIPEYEFHKNFGRKCEQCHVTSTWMAQKYPHEMWPLDDIHKVRCTRCHAKANQHDFSYYRCYGCHHEENAIRQSHAKLNIDDVSDCIRCHKGASQGSSN